MYVTCICIYQIYAYHTHIELHLYTLKRRDTHACYIFFVAALILWLLGGLSIVFCVYETNQQTCKLRKFGASVALHDKSGSQDFGPMQQDCLVMGC